ncbi:MAG: LPS translocon maturation chaperone LptM [Burkholderiaceae bacterium]
MILIVNSLSSLSRFGAIAVFVTLSCLCLLSACGQKGPLYLQTEPAPAAATNTVATPEATTPGKPASTPIPAAQ